VAPERWRGRSAAYTAAAHNAHQRTLHETRDGLKLCLAVWTVLLPVVFLFPSPPFSSSRILLAPPVLRYTTMRQPMYTFKPLICSFAANACAAATAATFNTQTDADGQWVCGGARFAAPRDTATGALVIDLCLLAGAHFSFCCCAAQAAWNYWTRYVTICLRRLRAYLHLVLCPSSAGCSAGLRPSPDRVGDGSCWLRFGDSCLFLQNARGITVRFLSFFSLYVFTACLHFSTLSLLRYIRLLLPAISPVLAGRTTITLKLRGAAG